jgi:hypothetical protein
MNGILDPPTMKSIYASQEATDNLQRCGPHASYTKNAWAGFAYRFDFSELDANSVADYKGTSAGL